MRPKTRDWRGGMVKVAGLLFALLVLTNDPMQAQTRKQYVDHARHLMTESPLVDGHNDFPYVARKNADLRLDSMDISVSQPSIMTDIPRLRRGLVGGQFWVAYSDPDFHHRGGPRVGMEQVDFIHQMIDRYDDFQFAGTAEEAMAAFDSGKIASIIALEGGHMIENSLGLLRQFYAAGVRYMTLTHGRNVDWADASTDEPEHGGLTKFGEEVVREMNRLGMMVDISHVSDQTMWDVLRVSEAPVIFSHSSARHFTPHRRNVPDDVLTALGEANGIIMINFVPGFIYLPTYEWDEERSAIPADERVSWVESHPPPLPDISVVADHIEYVRDLIGVEHVGIGGDFDGITLTPVGLEDVATYPELIAELLARGWSDDDAKKVMGLNILRVMCEVEGVASRLEERPVSTARIEILDEWDVSPEWERPRQ